MRKLLVKLILGSTMFWNNEPFPFDATYCISLLKSVERREHIKKELVKFDVTDYTIIDAVDKDDALINKAYKSNLVVLFPPCFRCGQNECNCENNILLPPQVATFFSHKLVWQKIVNKKEGLYLIIEDDIKFNWYFTFLKNMMYKKISNLYTEQKNDPFLLRLGWAKNNDHSIGTIRFIKNLSKMSNPMYAINPTMAQILLDTFSKIETTVDIYTHNVVGMQYNNFTLLPPMAHELSYSKGKMSSLIRPRQERIKKLRGSKYITAKKELEQYNEHIDRAINRKLLAVGHPRTGSGYISALLSAYGIDAGHEEMGKDGIVSWMFSVYDWSNPFYVNKYAKSRYYSNFDHIIMFARDPYTALPSIIRENNASYESYIFRQKHILENLNSNVDLIDSDLEKAIEIYLLWTKLVISLNKPEIIIRIEKDQEKLLKYLRKQNYALEIDKTKLPKNNVNSNKMYKGKEIDKPLIDHDQWLILDDRWKGKINELCDLLNYPPLYDKSLKRILR